MAATGLELLPNVEEKMRENSLKMGQSLIWERLKSHKPVNIPRVVSKSQSIGQDQSVIIDILAEEWLSKYHSLSTKLYLVEHLLPVLVLGLEKLLVRVGKRGLEEQTGHRTDFNPINILAQYLMRNNPRYRHSIPSCSPYSMGLNMVATRLRKIAIEGEESLEQRVKRQLMERKDQDIKEHNERIADEQKKRDALRAAATLWRGADGIPTLQIQQVLLAWLDDMKQHPQYDSIKGAFEHAISELVTSEAHLTEEQCIDTLLPGCLTLQFDSFILFSNHVIGCGKERKRTTLKEKRRKLFQEVFQYCDNENLTVVDRQQLLSILLVYYENAPKDVKTSLTNPKTWVIRGIEQPEEEEEEMDDWEREGSTVSDEDYQQFMSPSHNIMVTDKNEEKDEQESKTDSMKENIESNSDKHRLLSSSRPLSSGVPAKQAGRVVSKSPHHSSALPPVPTGPGEQWSPKHAALPQFLQICNLFIGEHPDEGTVESLGTFIKLNYHKDEVDILQSGASTEMQREALLMKRARKLIAIFTQWDINCSGYLSIDELETVLGHWEPFTTPEGKLTLSSAVAGLDKQVSRTDFSYLLDTLTEKMSTVEFKNFANFLTSSIKTSQEQQKRSAYRQQLIMELKSVGGSTSLNIIPALEFAVKAIHQDIAQLGGNKQLSVCIGLLDDATNNDTSPCLCYKAASDDCVDHVLGRKLNRSNAPISFSAIESGSPVHVPDVYKHGRVFFFIPSHSNKEEYCGSLVVAPIITPTGHVIGTISIDSIVPLGRTQHKFSNHEISFYQGMGVCLGEIYQYTVAKRQLIGAAEAGIAWLLRRCSPIVQINFYMIKNENNTKDASYSLQHTLVADQTLNTKITHCINIIHRKDNFFRDYLFQCVDTSESVSAEAYCYPHLACPLRDHTGCAVAVIDFTISQTCNNGRLEPQHLKNVGKMVKLLTTAFHQAMVQNNDKNTISNLDGDMDAITVLFHKLLLIDLQRSMHKIDKRAFAEMRSYIEPPNIIFKIVLTLILILYPEIECTSWAQCKKYVTIEILNAMSVFEPKPDEPHPKTNEILEILKDISPTDVYHHGSMPAKYLFNWISASSTVLEYIANSQKKAKPKVSISVENTNDPKKTNK